MPPDTSLPASRRLHADVWIALAILAFCAVVYWLTTTFDAMPAALVPGMGAAAFPRLLLGVMAVLALVLAWSSRGRPDGGREPVPAIVYLTVAAMLGFMAVLWLAGMVVAMVLGFIGMGLLWGERRWSWLVASAVGLAAFIYLLFTKGFGIPLPKGLFGEWLS
ncbi:MAG: hypothetical protein AVDCRST_MAG90-1126 [uncultured Microvirga sp.]|uniref:DUF1468 domain-containing protein n=1 Tax=uncultured Microvirga sp. TaxID=412392 RepID=A0A6J4L4B0_9HYPH|nr:MAG: hypothetical protein AVDCRST_MAG90-1126 [uncultured Microvirga sp.]